MLLVTTMVLVRVFKLIVACGDSRGHMRFEMVIEVS